MKHYRQNVESGERGLQPKCHRNQEVIILERGTFLTIFLPTIIYFSISLERIALEFYLDFNTVLFIDHMNMVKSLELWQNDTYILVLYEKPIN